MRDSGAIPRPQAKNPAFPHAGFLFLPALRAMHQLTLLSSFPMPIDANKETGVKGANAPLIWPSEQFCSDFARSVGV